MSAAVEGQDYYFNEAGLLVMTEASHLARGHCCGNHCRHCPYEYAEVASPALPAGELTIRASESADAPGIASAARQVFAATFGPEFDQPGRDLVPYLEENFGASRIGERLRATDGAWWSLVDADGQVWGACELSAAIDSDVPASLCLETFYVRREARRLGAAEALLQVAVGEAGARGAERVWVKCLKGNCLNIAFFTRQGFEIVAGREMRIGGQRVGLHLMARGV